MKKLLILTFVIGIFFPSISNASCKDDYSKSWKFSGSDALKITAENNTNRKIILVSFKIYTASEELMKTIPLNKTLEPYGVFEKYLFHKLNKRLIKLGGFSCKYHASVLEKKRREEEKKRAQERIKEDIEKRKKAEEARKKNEAARKKAEEEGKRKAEKERKKRNEETYLKNKTYEIVFDKYSSNRLEGIFKERKVLNNNVVLGKFTSINKPYALVGKFYGSAFHDGGVEYAIQYLICDKGKLKFVNYNREKRRPDKVLKLTKRCDSLKLQLIEYENYIEEEIKKARNKKITFWIVAVLIVLFVIYISRAYRKNAVINYNKTHKNKIKTYTELQKILDKKENERLLAQLERDKKEELLRKKKEEAEIKKKEKEKKEEETKRLKKEKRLAKVESKIDTEEISGNIGARLKKLKKMYKDGILSKVEFEKAKNKLLQ